MDDRMNYRLDELEINDWYLLIRLIAQFCELSEGELCLKINDFDFAKVVKKTEDEGINYNQVDYMMKQLGDRGIIKWDVIGDEEVHYPDFTFTFNKQTFQFIREVVIKKLQDERVSLISRIRELETELNSVYGFSPSVINERISRTKENVEELLSAIKKNELLKSLERPVLEFSEYTDRIKEINNSYQNIYGLIIKPVQEEGRRGVKATVLWAIISIAVATLLSWLISNWNSIKTIVHGITT